MTAAPVSSSNLDPDGCRTDPLRSAVSGIGEDSSLSVELINAARGTFESQPALGMIAEGDSPAHEPLVSTLPTQRQDQVV